MSKTKKRLSIIFGILFITVLVIVFIFNGIVANILENKLDKYLMEHPVKNYTLKYKNIGFNLLNKSIKLKGFTYTPKKEYIDSLVSSGFQYMVPEVTMGTLSINGIDFFDALKNKVINIRRIKLKDIHIKLNQIDGKKDETKEKEKNNRKTIIPDSIEIKGINSLFIKSFTIRNTQIEIYNLKKKKLILTNREARLTVDDINLKKKQPASNFLFPAIKNILFEVKKNVYYTSDNLYKITFDKLKTNFRSDGIIINNFHYEPLYSKTAFSKQLKYQQERYDISTGELITSQIDFNNLLYNNELSILKVILKDPAINIYRDKRLPFPHYKRPLLPHQALKKMAMKLHIDTVHIDNATFVYQEKTDLNSKTLYLDFTKLTGNITNICNVDKELAKNDKMKVSLKGRLMGKAPFNLLLSFPMQARNDTFVFSGTVYGKVPFEIFNKAIYPAAGIKFDGGTLNKLTFTGGANPTFATGKMTALYNNLKLHVVKEDEVSRNKVLSFGASAIVRKNNPSGGDPPKEAIMVFERDIEKGFGNFFWKTILSGLKGSMIVSYNTLNKNKYNKLSRASSVNANSKKTSKKKKKWFWQKKKKKKKKK